MRREIERRMQKLESKHAVGEPKQMFSCIPLTTEIRDDVSQNWRQWVADGRASMAGETLINRAPRMTTEQWLRSVGGADMGREIKRRLGRLESVSTLKGRPFTLWDDGAGGIEAEIERLRREEGMKETDRLVIIKWLSPQE